MDQNIKTILLSIFTIAFLIISPALAQNDMCEMCHNDPDLTQVESGIPRSLYVHTALIDSSVHAGLSCVDCHTTLDGFDDFPHAEKLLGVNCADCHNEAFEMYMSGFYEHLAQRGFTSIPGCTQCHGNHEISNQTDTRTVCGICHSEQKRLFEMSVHYDKSKEEYNGVNCTSCHSAHEKSERGNMLPPDWRLFTVKKCLACHQDQSENYLSSLHYKKVQEGDARAPICTDCHGTHELYAIDNPRSSVHVDKLDRTCDRCHPGHEATIHRKSGVDDKLMTCVACHTGHHTDMNMVQGTVFDETLSTTCNRCHGEDRHQKEALAHGNIMVVNTDGGSVNCTECHNYHWKLSEAEHITPTTAHLECKYCHAEQNNNYERSVHGIAFRKGHEEAPTCVTCHGSKEVERISSKFDGQSVISLCGSCHGNSEVTMKFQLNPNVITGYLGTYHGQVYSLGYQGRKFATCTSCHDNHLILPSDNPESSISKEHIIQTCGRCHDDANENFVGMLQHYDPMVKESMPFLTFLHVFMIWLLGGTLSLFGIHTILWLGRAIYNRFKHGKEIQDPTRKRVRYIRFIGIERILHAIVMVSFLLMAMTGLPLKYSQSASSQWIAANLMDLHTMALLHRIGAVMTFSYFALHLGMLIRKLLIKEQTIMQLLWGSESLVPQPNDLKEFIQHVKWFVGLGEKPQFGRWAYWEKFDYLAVFWGVAVIGLSGLTLWFPEFFTKLLPGWAINAAHIIHSEEALLATGFIFTIHFFNEHLRPDNFPFDEVMFTGSMSEHYIKTERNRWYEDMKEKGKLEERRTGPMKFFPRFLLYVFGFTALAVGLALLALIIMGTFSL